ncbi:MAG: VanZ family protein [Oscillospiraceae bacterium]|nr:VanZ family protein [Oscillospiraceae bacterium]
MKRSSRKIYILAALVVLWTGFIWWNSTRDSSQSGAESLWVLAQLQAVLGALGLDDILTNNIVRKAAHFCEFALLGAGWSLLFGRGKRRWALAGWTLAAAAACMATAVCDETIQLFSDGRGSRVSDVWIDVAGAVLGASAVSAVRCIVRAVGRHNL